MDLHQIAATAIARARDAQGLTAAEFDYRIKIEGIGGPLGPIGNEVYLLANAHVPEPEPGRRDNRLEERSDNHLALWEQLQPEMRAYEQRCRQRRFVGWSSAAQAAGQRIRYDDQPAPEGTLTEAQRQELLDRAVTAVRRLRGGDGGTQEAQEVARLAVTDAVTRGGYDHTAIADATGLTGLDVAELITDWSAQAQALGAERQAAADYAARVRRACASHSRRRIDAQGYGAQAAIAREMQVTPLAVGNWVKKGKS